MNLRPLQQLTGESLRALADSLRDGALSAGITRHGLEQIAGPLAVELRRTLEDLGGTGFTPRQMAVVLEAALQGREHAPDPGAVMQLVLSGPDVAGVPTADTAAVTYTLIAGARTEILLVGYAVHNGKKLFEPLARRLREVPGLQVRFCLDVRRPHGDSSLADEIVRRFAREFRSKHWPWEYLPEVYYDPRAMELDAQRHAALHAKCIVVDRQAALVTSANFTDAAQTKNIEAGVLVRHEPIVRQLADYFQALIAQGLLVRCALPE